MAELTEQTEFTGDIQQVFENIIKYESYPEYIPGVTQCEVQPSDDPEAACQVRYEMNLIKKFYYVLTMYHEPNKKIWWKLKDSNLMKSNDGGWDLQEASKGKTKADYHLNIKFRGLVPGAVTNKIAASSMPTTFKGFQKLIDDNP